MGKEERFQELYDGFEEKDLSDIWSHKKFEEGAIEIQSKIVRKGKKAAKITVRKGDIKMKGSKNMTERAELLEKKEYGPSEDENYNYSFSMFIPKDFPIVSTRLVLAQWKQKDDKEIALITNPILALRYENGELFITLKTSTKRKTLFSTNQEIRGKWIDFVFHLRFTRKAEGFVKIWMNKKMIVDYKGLTAYSEKYNYAKEGHFFFKMGLYRDTMDEPMTIYIDEFRKSSLKSP